MKKTVLSIIALSIVLGAIATGCTAKKQAENKGTIKEYGLTVDYEKSDSNINLTIYQDGNADSFFYLVISQDRNDSTLDINLSQNFPKEESMRVWSISITGFDLDDKSKILGEVKEVLLSSEQDLRFVNNVESLAARMLW